MGNVFLGLIVDTFAVLRDKNSQIDEDISGVCFICGLTVNQSHRKNINFEEHRTIDHDVWKTVDFMIHLQVVNPQDLNDDEHFVWEKLAEKDTFWIPTEEES